MLDIRKHLPLIISLLIVIVTYNVIHMKSNCLCIYVINKTTQKYNSQFKSSKKTSSSTFRNFKIKDILDLDSSSNSPPVVQTTSPNEISWKQDLGKILGIDMLTVLESVSTR
jgi:hypothetical protein